jgi:hypothetical protein
MMQPTCPVNSNIRVFMIKLDCRIDAPSTRYLTKLKKSWKTWAIIFSNVKLFVILFLSTCDRSWWTTVDHVWSDPFNVINVFVQMKVYHLLISCFVRCLQKKRNFRLKICKTNLQRLSCTYVDHSQG